VISCRAAFSLQKKSEKYPTFGVLWFTEQIQIDRDNGTVDGREAKRMAEDCVWNVPGVRNVTNTIRVESDKHGHVTTGTGGMEEKSRRGTSGQTGKNA